MAKKFIKTGFEFTAALKAKENLKGNLEKGNFSHRVRPQSYSKPISKFNWINDRYSSDDCGMEISTPIIKSNKRIIKSYKEFVSFVKSVNLTTNIDEAVCCLGGCHIHKDLSYMDKNFKKLFLKNICVFFTNYPQLNWGFNDPNDNWNANSLFAINKQYSNYYNNCIIRYRNILINKDFGGIENWKTIKSVESYVNSQIIELTKKKKQTIFEQFIDKPLEYDITKEYVFRYNDTYKTLEMRMFDMPTSLKQHILHNDVANAIYDYCFNLTKKNIELKLNITELKKYKFTLDESLDMFKEAMKTLNISLKRTNKMIQNIHTRYHWNKIHRNENYLL